MISDFQILGIEETDDPTRIKSAFRKRAKELHPDLSTAEDAFARHDLFNAVCMAYRRLLDGRRGVEDPQGRSGAPGPKSGEVAVYADQAYAFYKNGMRHFMKIHPSQWVIDESDSTGAKVPDSAEEREQGKRKVMEIAKLFPKAYYYFSIVANEYPDSEWAYDAREKMGKIEERIGRYRKIIESFTANEYFGHRSAREHRAMYLQHEETKRSVREDGGRGWDRR